MEELLAKLDRAEGPNCLGGLGEIATMQPLLIAFEIVEAIEKAANARTPLEVEAAADAIVARYPHSGVTRNEIVEVLREEGSVAGVLLGKPAGECGVS
jgi:hypothetical protein